MKLFRDLVNDGLAILMRSPDVEVMIRILSLRSQSRNEN
jgi:hypothetical protein